jgi:hypothetical protein
MFHVKHSEAIRDSIAEDFAETLVMYVFTN